MTASHHAPDTLQPADTWRNRALCRLAKRPDVMFPPGKDAVAIRTAKQWCARCPVVRECAAWALGHHVQHGVWGGLDEADRRRVLRNRTQRRDAT